MARGDEVLSNIYNETENAVRVILDGDGDSLNINSIPANTYIVKFSQDLSVGALDFTTSIGENSLIEEIELSFSASATQSITITKIDSDSNYSNKRYDEGATPQAHTDFVYDEGDGRIKCFNAEEIRVQCTNTSTPSIVVYGKITYSK